MAKRVLSTICFKVSAGSSNDTGSSPSAITEKSSRGSVPSWKRARPATIVILPSAAASWTWLPSGSLRAMSNSVCADTVVAPGWSTAAATLSLICRSRSVAISFSVPSAVASIGTLDRIGMVLRRSTTDWTWLSPLSSVARSIVAFMIVIPRAGAQSFPPDMYESGGNLPSYLLNGKRGRSKRSDPDINSFSVWFGLEPHAHPPHDLVTIGIDREVVGVAAVGIFQPRVAVVRIAIFELGIGLAAERLFEARARAPAVEVEMLAGFGRAVRRDEVEPLVGVTALGVEQRRWGDAIAGADAGIELASGLYPAITERAGGRRIVGDLAGRSGDFAFDAEHPAVARNVVPDIAAIGQAAGRIAVVDVRIGHLAGL